MMRRSNNLLLLGLTLFTLNTFVSAANFFPNLAPEEVQKVFDEADQSGTTSFLINTSSKNVPAVQILPITDTPRTTITSGTQCIKLYNCNQGICLVGLNNNKYATNEQILIDATSEQKDINHCSASATADKLIASNKTEVSVPVTVNNTDITEKDTLEKPIFSWVKVINVKQDDELNIRKIQNYKSEKLGTAAYNETCIKRYKCNGKWCQIENKQTTGWVHRKFIEKMDDTSSQSCSS